MFFKSLKQNIVTLPKVRKLVSFLKFEGMWTFWLLRMPSSSCPLIGPELPPSNGSNPYHWSFFDWALIFLGSLIWNFSTNPIENSFLANRSFFCHECDCAGGLGLAACRTLASKHLEPNSSKGKTSFFPTIMYPSNVPHVFPSNGSY